MSERDPESLALAYYETIDDGAYEALSALLAPDFRQVRGDRILDGRDAFVRFMRDGRPEADTSHAVDAVYAGEDGDAVAVRGRLLRADGTLWFGFVDVFCAPAGAIEELLTYTR